MSSSRPVEPSDQVAIQIDDPPCTVHYCGHSWGVIDGFMVAGVTVTAIGSFVSTPWWVPCGLLVVGWGLTRKYGNLSVVVDEYKKAQGVFAETLQGQKQVTEEQKALVVRLGEEKGALEEQNQRLSGEVNALKGSIGQLKQTIAGLEAANQKFGAHVQGLKEVNGQLHQGVEDLTGQNSRLEAGVKSVGAAVAGVEQVAPKIDIATEKVDQRIDEDLADLKEKILRAHSLTDALKSLSREQQRQIAELNETDEKFDENEENLKKQVAALQVEVASLKEVEEQLRATLQKMVAESAAMVKAVEEKGQVVAAPVDGGSGEVSAELAQLRAMLNELGGGGQ